MKIGLLILLFPILCIGQTAAERQKIVATYDAQQVQKLKNEASVYMARQRQLVDEYRRTHNVPEDNQYHSLQRIIDGVPIYFTIFNEGSSKTINANSMYPGGSLGLNIDGSGITAGVWDGGKVRNTHQEFTNNRVTLSDNADVLSSHATHVTGTIIAAGISSIRKGIAYGASAHTYDWFDDHEEMIAFGAAGYLVSNHSYGYTTTDLPIWKFGSYDASSIEIDNVASTFPYYQIVIAAGNDRDNPNLAQAFNENGYDLLSGTGLSKNGLTISAVSEVLNYLDQSSVVMSDFSNFGPPDDGRIKPDLAAKGVGVSSTISSNNSAYEIYQGTSMAAPAVAGLVVLLQKHYSNLYGNYMRASTVRGLLCHTAREAGNYPGPDYEYGWGLADGKTSAQIISGKSLSTVMEENTLATGGSYSRQISISSPQHLTVTLCWTDPVGNANNSGTNDNRTPRLRNNLDLKVYKDGVVYFPWKLDVEEPFFEATRVSDNNVDNVEKLEIDLAQPGTYTIEVTHKGTGLVGETQVFSLIASGTSGLTLAANDFDFKDGIVLYPNPVKNILNFSIPSTVAVTDVTLFDILGKQVLANASLINNAIDVSTLSNGIYMAKISYDGKSIVKKFVKE